MRTLILSGLLLCCGLLSAQKKTLDHSDFEIWNSIEGERISPDGNYILYSLEKGEKDQFLKLKRRDGSPVFSYDRAGEGRFTHDSKFAVFSIHPWKDSVAELRRRKVKKDDLPKDSLGVYNLLSGSLDKVAGVRSVKVPEKWSGFVAFQLEPGKEPKKKEGDTTSAGKGKKAKKPGKKNGYHLVVRELQTGRQDTFKFVTDYVFSKKAKRLAFASTGETDSSHAALYVLDLEKELLKAVHSGRKAEYQQLAFSDSGKHLGFVADEDTTKVQVRPTRLYYWNEDLQDAQVVSGDGGDALALRPSKYARVHFSEDDSRMFFGLARPRALQDTSLLEEEIVNVEVWTYDEPRLYTVQEMQLKNDTIGSYAAVVALPSRTVRQLATEAYPEIELGDEGNAAFALLSTSAPYELPRQWTGRTMRDYALVSLEDGSRKKVLEGISGRVDLSPKGMYIFGYREADSTWFTHNIQTGQGRDLTRGKAFFDELNDTPDYPRAYGLAGWTEKDQALILYDRYDVWRFDPDTGAGERLTKGRETKTVYRYVQTDPEERFLSTKAPWLLTTFDETDKHSGYALLDPRRPGAKELVQGPYRYGTPVKAAEAETYLFTRESFEEFPDIWAAGKEFKNPVKISNANPQQADYRWGTNELVEWTSLDGVKLQGMLVKPEGFDPSRKYPMLVNFYEKSSDDVYRHRAPSPGRSTINYSFYASRGYLIFNPDVHYRTGYPGESAYNCVVPGVTSLIEKGFVDPGNIGVQGHSWGGYQIAYLVTRTDLFKAAEAGAPVPNMISAYGGIRWWTGLSRQFQYEHTQSRIGGTPWEYPMRYLENSPIFNIDKINTPLLIMHNDADGHVPWYQGIEFFVSLRRLGKPAWFLNYNGEPHWPLKLQNRKDFNIRMAQFFDHYLKGAPLPVWMHRGVPAMEKGINQGYELMESGGDR
jgi:dipeptidyl aminopeptidase/acylaminoacyl peptidase